MAPETPMRVDVAAGTIRIAIELPVPPPKAWAMLTEQAHIANWWGDYVKLDARPGGRLVECWSDGTREVVTAGRVTRCEPPVALDLTWADDDWPGDTKVTFRLQAQVKGTRLMLEHSGWGVHTAARRKELIEAHAGGWSSHMKKPATYAAQGGQRGRES